MHRLAVVVASLGLVLASGLGALVLTDRVVGWLLDPRFTPIAGHWRMLVRNAGEHVRGEAPVLAQGGTVDPRTGITPDEQQTLLHAIDLWWLYAGYAGVPRVPLAAAALVLLAGSVWAWGLAWRTVREDRA